MPTLRYLRWLFLASALLCTAVAAQTIDGRVVKVYDGDTITVLDNSNTQHKVRLSGIDAPELKQAFGQASRKHLASLVGGQLVTIEWEKRDRYGRIVGKVLQGSADAGLAQIVDGMAWHYKKYQNEQSAEDRRAYADAEVQARIQKVGLWSEKDIAPWEYRIEQRRAKQ